MLVFSPSAQWVSPAATAALQLSHEKPAGAAAAQTQAARATRADQAAARLIIGENRALIGVPAL
jgi:hypothetical protein